MIRARPPQSKRVERKTLAAPPHSSTRRRVSCLAGLLAGRHVGVLWVHRGGKEVDKDRLR